MHLKLVVDNSIKNKESSKKKIEKALTMQKKLIGTGDSKKLSADELVELGHQCLRKANTSDIKKDYISAETYALAAKKMGEDLDSDILLTNLYYFMGGFEASLDIIYGYTRTGQVVFDGEMSQNIMDMNEAFYNENFVDIAKEKVRRFPGHWALRANLGRAYLNNEDFKNALKHYTYAEKCLTEQYSDFEIKMNRHMVTPIFRCGEILFYQGVESEEKGEYYWKRVERKFQRAMELGFESTDLYYYFGSIEEMKGNYKKATQYLNQSLEIDSKNFESILSLFWINIDTRDFQKAKEYLMQMKQIDPENENCKNAEQHLKRCTKKRVLTSQKSK